MPAAFASSTARRAPFSLSLPRCAMPPVSGATWPILTSVPPACAAGVAAPLSAAGLGASLLQPASAIATASSESASFEFFIDSSEVVKLLWADILTPPCPRKSTAPAGASGYFCDRIHFTSDLMSLSGTWLLGGIGTWPQTPWPPFFTFSKSFASACLSSRYFAATSLYDGPTSFLSTAWQAKQLCFLASSSCA